MHEAYRYLAVSIRSKFYLLTFVVVFNTGDTKGK